MNRVSTMLALILTSALATTIGAPGQVVAARAASPSCVPPSTATAAPERASSHAITPDEVSRQANFRADIGFRSDEAFVRDINEHPEKYDALAGPTTYGLTLTPAEHAEINRRIRVQEHLCLIRQYLDEQAPTVALGVTMDHLGGGTVRVGLTADVERHVAEIKRRFPFPEQVVGYQARYSRATLQSVADDVHASRVRLSSEGIATTGIYVDKGLEQVVVGVEQATESARQRLYDEFGEEYIDVVEAAPARPEHFDPGRDALFSPLRGGTTSREDNDDLCTWGFVAYRMLPDGARVHYMVTAGHCDPYNRLNAYQGLYADGSKRLLGQITRRNEGNRSDVAAVSLAASASTSRWIYAIPSKQALAMVVQLNRSQYGEDDVVCLSGIHNSGNHSTTTHATGENCGRINGEDVSIGFGWCFCFMRTNYAHQAGDSGGPVYRGGSAMGLHQGSWFGFGVFTNIQYAMEDIGLAGIRTY